MAQENKSSPEVQEPKLKRAWTFNEIDTAKISTYPFTEDWKEAFGNPESTGVWTINGGSGSGKTRFILMLIKELAKYEDKILFESYEEGEASANLQDGMRDLNFKEIQRKLLVTTDTLEELEIRLRKKKSPRVVVLDSLPYTEFKTARQFILFSRKFKKHLFIMILQGAEKDLSKLAKSIRHDANQKISVEGYRALNRGRSQGNTNYLTIWNKGAREYWEYK